MYATEQIILRGTRLISCSQYKYNLNNQLGLLYYNLVRPDMIVTSVREKLNSNALMSDIMKCIAHILGVVTSQKISIFNLAIPVESQNFLKFY